MRSPRVAGLAIGHLWAAPLTLLGLAAALVGRTRWLGLRGRPDAQRRRHIPSAGGHGVTPGTPRDASQCRASATGPAPEEGDSGLSLDWPEDATHTHCASFGWRSTKTSRTPIPLGIAKAVPVKPLSVTK